MAGPDQSPDHPLGVDGTLLHEWVVATRTFREMIGQSGGSESVDDDVVRRWFEGIGAMITGRNMFGPVRGPYRCDVFWRSHSVAHYRLVRET